MKRRALSLLIICFVASAYCEAGPKDAFTALFPSTSGSWRPSDSLRIFSGKKLYDLIDGGADIYLEYGFVRAGSRHYRTPLGGEISLEVHEMRDTLAAWGIFSFLVKETGSPAVFGQEGVEGDDFVIFWKNRFVVLVTALNEGGRADLGGMARDVDGRIRPAGRRPALAEALLQPEFRNNGVMFMRGALAFDRGGGFGLGDVFRLREGVSGIYGDCRTMILRYARRGECRSAVLRGIRLLRERGGFRELAGSTPAGLLASPQGVVLQVLQDRRYLLLTIGEDEKSVTSTAGALARAVATRLNP